MESRAAFVKEELAALEPAAIVERYKVAQLAGDADAVWLIAKYGRVELARVLDDHPDGNKKRREALTELEALSPPEPDDVFTARMARINEIQKELTDARGTAEVRENQHRVNAKYGVAEYGADAE